MFIVSVEILLPGFINKSIDRLAEITDIYAILNTTASLSDSEHQLSISLINWASASNTERVDNLLLSPRLQQCYYSFLIHRCQSTAIQLNPSIARTN